MVNNNVSVAAKLPKELKDKLYNYCKENDLSMSQVIRKAVIQFLNK